MTTTATAWARKLIGNGADPHVIAAWMRHELDADPLAFRDLLTPAEIQQVALRHLAVRVTAATGSFRTALVNAVPVIRRLNAAIAAISTGHPTGMPAEVEASITQALAEEARNAH